MCQQLEMVIENINFCKILSEEIWRVKAVKDLSLVLSGHLYLEDFTKEEAEEMLQNICVT